MYVAKIGKSIVKVGDTLTIDGDFELEVLEIMASGIRIKWLNGYKAEDIDYLLFDLFRKGTMASYEIPEGNDPNTVFRNKKHEF